jgi:hypothetical protein
MMLSLTSGTVAGRVVLLVLVSSVQTWPIRIAASFVPDKHGPGQPLPEVSSWSKD